jgi:hypothetical protein
MSNLCRDEVTVTLKTKLDTIFGSSFNTNGLGGVLTCGVTGVKAGLSHSPISAVGDKQDIVPTRYTPEYATGIFASA